MTRYCRGTFINSFSERSRLLSRHTYVAHKEEPAYHETITNSRLGDKPYVLSLHRKASILSDKVAYALVKTLRFPTDLFFAKRYGHRAIVLETVGTRSVKTLLRSYLTAADSCCARYGSRSD